MIGIYKITNLINGKSYIGQSVNINKRFIAHKSAAFNTNNKKYNFPLYRAIRKYGIDNFRFDVLEECTESELNNKEKYYILEFQTLVPNGYNQDEGGTSCPHYVKLSDDLVDAIIQRLKTSVDNSDVIGNDFGVTGRTIRSINAGEYCRKDTEKYPIRPHLYSVDRIQESVDTNADEYKIEHIIKESVHYCKECGVVVATKNSYCVSCGQKSQRKADRPDKLELARLVSEHGFTNVGRCFGVSDNTIKSWCKSYNLPYLKAEIISWYNKQIGIEAKDVDTNVVEKIIKNKPVEQIDMKTNDVLNIFESENEAARSLGKKKGNHIGEVCNGILDSAYGFKWRYVAI